MKCAELWGETDFCLIHKMAQFHQHFFSPHELSYSQFPYTSLASYIFFFSLFFSPSKSHFPFHLSTDHAKPLIGMVGYGSDRGGGCCVIVGRGVSGSPGPILKGYD